MPLSWRSWIANEGSKHFILVLWLSTNTALFWKTFVSYCSGPQHYYLHKMLGTCWERLYQTIVLKDKDREANFYHQLGLCVSRASAAVLNLNCCLVLLPVCRSLLAGLRGFQKVTSRKARRILDKRKTFHVACGVAIGLFSVIHVSAHLANVYSFSVWYSDEFPALNLAHHRGEDPRIIMFTTVPGATGVLLVLVLFLMFTASSYGMRVSNYDIFWYTHNLSIVFYIILLIHVIGGVLKYQTNVEQHPPDCFRPNRTVPGGQSLGFGNSSQVDGFSKVCRADPQFQAHFPETWLWVSGPLCLYCAERLYRYMCGCRPVTVASVVRHPCRVVEVHMQKSDFRARPGQYIVLNCPHVSRFESHPFTLTTCPTERNATFGIHLRVLGDWTERFTDLLLAEPEVGAEVLPVAHQRRYPRVYVDGPFGSPSEDVFNYEVSVCVAGGIGVTPFASVLQALLDDWQHHKLRRLYFIWVCRELQSFCWFAELLCSLHQKLWQENRPDYLNIRLYVSEERSLQSLSEGRYQVLSTRLLIGRPRWELLFEEIGRANKQKRVGVFCSGPKGLSTTLHKMCNSSHFGATFEYNKESFS